MTQPMTPWPSGQRQAGPYWDCSAEAYRRGLRGQMTPEMAQEYQAMHGRYLAGLGEFPGAGGEPSPGTFDDTDLIHALEAEDDNYGTGIFDPHRRPPTSDVDMGTLASDYALPGYIARERWFAESEEVANLPSGAPVVIVPGGGMAYVERLGRQVPPTRARHLPPPPPLLPSPPTGRFQPYAFTDGGGGAYDPAVEMDGGPAAIEVPVEREAPLATPYHVEDAAPFGELPPGFRRARWRELVGAPDVAYGVPGRPETWPSHSPYDVPGRDKAAAYRALARRVAHGLGAEPEEPPKPSYLTYIFVGAMVGAAAALIHSAVRGGR